MKKLLVFGFSICLELVVVAAISGQKIVKIPNNEVLPMIAVQEASPLKIERFVVVSGLEKTFSMLYSVKNVSSKNVVSYRILRSYDTGTGFFEFGAMPEQKILRPGQSYGTVENLRAEEQDSIYKGDLKALAFIMIVEVMFEDGTSFSATSLLDALDKRLKMYRIQ